jgi:tetratricopeptide (TPR) repeat protein
MVNLGHLYYHGEKTAGIQKNTRKAMELYEKAVDLYISIAMFDLGWEKIEFFFLKFKTKKKFEALIHEDGDEVEGIRIDIEKAIDLYQKAADRGVVI